MQDRPGLPSHAASRASLAQEMAWGKSPQEAHAASDFVPISYEMAEKKQKSLGRLRNRDKLLKNVLDSSLMAQETRKKEFFFSKTKLGSC
jgi:hypothetical protein